jgi:hypothetical protein
MSVWEWLMVAAFVGSVVLNLLLCRAVMLYLHDLERAHRKIVFFHMIFSDSEIQRAADDANLSFD